MGEQIGISKAARMLRIKPSELSKRLSMAGIPTFEGKVDFDKVKCIAPTLNIGDLAMERLRHIREVAINPSQGQSVATESTQELIDKIQHLTSKLAVEAQMSEHYIRIIEAMSEELGKLQLSEDGERRELAFELCEWLREEVTKT